MLTKRISISSGTAILIMFLLILATIVVFPTVPVFFKNYAGSSVLTDVAWRAAKALTVWIVAAFPYLYFIKSNRKERIFYFGWGIILTIVTLLPFLRQSIQ